MSLLKLKTKKEPLHKTKNIINYDNNVRNDIVEPIEQIKTSCLMIGEGASIKGEIKKKMKLMSKV